MGLSPPLSDAEWKRPLSFVIPGSGVSNRGQASVAGVKAAGAVRGIL